MDLGTTIINRKELHRVAPHLSTIHFQISMNVNPMEDGDHVTRFVPTPMGLSTAVVRLVILQMDTTVVVCLDAERNECAVHVLYFPCNTHGHLPNIM